MESMKNQHGMQHTQKSEENNPNHSLAMYKRFALMAVAMFVAMYFIMYAMIDGLQNLIPNINNLYMTLLMVSAMLVIELWIMKGMYQNKKNQLGNHNGFLCDWHLLLVWYSGAIICGR